MRIRLSTLSLLLLFTLFLQAQSNVTVKFIAIGNCGQCKDRIEAMLDSRPGVSYSHWDYINEVVTVTYDMSTTDVHEVMRAVADTGHDTEWYEAPYHAYSLLVNTCCEYNKVINYDSVQIGYLSLMGVWDTALDLKEEGYADKIQLYPSTPKDHIYLQTELPEDGSYTLHILTLDGREVLNETIMASESQQLDLSHLAEGMYLVSIRTHDKLIYTRKIIKQ